MEPVPVFFPALPWGLLVLVSAHLFPDVLALVEPDGGLKMGRGLASHQICPDGAEKVCFRHFRQSGQLLLLPIHLLLQVVPPVFLFPQPNYQ